TYWVATNGNDNNAGTQQAPFQSISHAASLAGPGDIVYVEAGTYYDHVYETNSGTASAPIIFSCAPGALGQVNILPDQNYLNTCNLTYGGVFVIHAAQYVWINGFNIEGPMGRSNTNSTTYGGSQADSSNLPGFCGISWENGAGYGCEATNDVIYGNPH